MRIPRKNPSSPRRGGVLLLFVLLVAVVLGIAGVVIDIGTAGLTQAEMQAAVDTAAIEGCRLRNYEEYPGISHQSKRGRVTNLVRQVFDDDLRPTQGPVGGASAPDGPDSLSYAAGPGHELSGGVGPLNALATLGQVSPEEQADLDDPILQSNLDNHVHGDQVAGVFLPDATPGEGADYVRGDFERLPGVQSYQALSYLVRMRRSGTTNPLDADSGVSSTLPRLPFLFGLGSLMAQAEGQTWDPRRDGLSVRATAVASARPALRVGAPPRQGGIWLPDQSTSASPILGTFPFALSLEAWESLGLDADGDWHAARRFDVLPDGGLTLDGQLVGTRGRFYAPVANSYFPPPGETSYAEYRNALASIGREVRPPNIANPQWGIDSDQQNGGYVPIYDTILGDDGPRQRVVGYGFGYAEYTSNPVVCAEGAHLLIFQPGFNTQYSSFGSWVAQDNASSSLGNPAADPAIASLTEGEWRAILERNMALAYGAQGASYDYRAVRRGTVLAPALSR
jgi:hypothetical protein